MSGTAVNSWVCLFVRVPAFLFLFLFPQQLKALGSQGGPEVRFHQGSTRVPQDSARAAGWCEH